MDRVASLRLASARYMRDLARAFAWLRNARNESILDRVLRLIRRIPYKSASYWSSLPFVKVLPLSDAIGAHVAEGGVVATSAANPCFAVLISAVITGLPIGGRAAIRTRRRIGRVRIAFGERVHSGLLYCAEARKLSFSFVKGLAGIFDSGDVAPPLVKGDLRWSEAAIRGGVFDFKAELDAELLDC